MGSVTKTDSKGNHLTGLYPENNHSNPSENVPSTKALSLKVRIIESIEANGNSLIGIADKVYGSIAYILGMSPPTSKESQ